MLSVGEKNFHRGQVPALYPEKRTGAGKGRFPCDPKMPAPEAVGGAVGNSRFLG